MSAETLPVATLNRIAELATEGSRVEIVKISPPAGFEHLPAEIPVAVKYSKQAEIVDVSPLLHTYAIRPPRRRGAANVETLESFCDLVNRHKTPDSVIFAKTSYPAPNLQAVIDYHSLEGVPAFCQHLILYSFPLTGEFQEWMKLDGESMGQAEFAAFLEDHAAELADPSAQEKLEYEPLFKDRFAAPAEVIALSRNLEIFVGSKVKRAERLQSGERVVRFETEHTTAGGEPVDIPGIVMLSIRAFVDGAPVRIPTRLRYRVSGGDIKWSYQLYRAGHWLRRAVQESLDVARKITGLPAFEGAPEK